MRVCWCKCVHRPASSSTVTQSPEPLTDTWHWARTQTCHFCVSTPPPHTHTFSSIRCAAQPQLSQSHRGILPSVGSRPQDTEPSFHGLHKHTRPRKNLPLTGGNHGNWHEPQGPVSWYPCAQNHHARVLQTPEEQQRQRCWHLEGDAVFQGALWLIGEKQSGYSCQMHQMNANKPVRMLGSAFFRKKRVGSFGKIRLWMGKLTKQICHT